MMMNLKDRVKQFESNLTLMENREKGDLKRLFGTSVTITDYGFMADEGDKQYVAFVVEEDPDHFYFGGFVLTDNMLELDADGFHDEIIKSGLPVQFNSKMSKNKREYTTVKFYPETDFEAPTPRAKTKK